tara:strand:- start:53 stop:1258 length:1206 start_codon:yes stop_codon:yes gene_type:complete
MVMSKIFVQIASYRDPELVPTIRDLIAKSKYPDNLTFGICWQRDDTESLEEFINDPRFRVIDVPWNKSKGLCWARSLIQKLWSGEEYTLQLDSHHRFAQDWDDQLIEMIRLTGSEKPIVGSYAGMYDPIGNKILNYEPYKMVADRFTDHGTIMFYPHAIPNHKELTKPIPARFVSGHFYFTIGKHCEEYKYDPNIYFAGDEISLSIRSYTLGYDLFHPHKLVVWHEYTRKNRVKHWDDFNESNVKTNKVDRQWWEMDRDSKMRLRHMLREEDNNIDLGEYGLGSVRSHRDYELYAGIDFARRRLHQKTLAGENPPINDDTDWYKLEEKNYKYTLSIPTTQDFKFIYVGIEDDRGKVIYRNDLTQYIESLNIEIKSFTKPKKWVYWPVDKNGNWGTRRDFTL